VVPNQIVLNLHWAKLIPGRTYTIFGKIIPYK
jgi:hypothetical protein